MSDWQPIETAPYNTPILIAAYKCVWVDGIKGRRIVCAVWKSKIGGLFHIHGAMGYDMEEEFENPTHWMKLPEPPK